MRRAPMFKDMLRKITAKSEQKWEETHYQPSEIILKNAAEHHGEVSDHAVLMAVLAFLDEEVGSARERESMTDEPIEPEPETPQQASEWISVKERLPEEGVEHRVIIFADKRAPFLPEVLWGYYEFKAWHTQWGRCDRVTHWMPMPARP